MSLVAGPGRGGASSNLPDELQLAVVAHVLYIQSLDTVCFFITADMLSVFDD
jgi:geranylgeranyl transferase type-2 subunit beta